jgi:hypothetical protein
MRVKLPLIVVAAAVAVLGSAPLAAAGDRPVNGRITFGRFDPALGFISRSLRTQVSEFWR